jgi:hypothetical protein
VIPETKESSAYTVVGPSGQALKVTPLSVEYSIAMVSPAAGNTQIVAGSGALTIPTTTGVEFRRTLEKKSPFMEPYVFILSSL